MHAYATILNMGFMTDEFVNICYRHNEGVAQHKRLVHLPSYLVTDLVIYRQSYYNNLPTTPPKPPWPSLFPEDDLYKLGKYIIVEELRDNNVPYEKIVHLLVNMEKTIMDHLEERNIDLDTIIKVDFVYDTAILWIL